MSSLVISWLSKIFLEIFRTPFMVYMYVYVVVSESKEYKAFTHPSKSGLRVGFFFFWWGGKGTKRVKLLAGRRRIQRGGSSRSSYS